MNFHYIICYAPELVFSMRTRMRKFISRLFGELILKRKVVLLNKNMDRSRLVVYMQQVKIVKKNKEKIKGRVRSFSILIRVEVSNKVVRR